MSQKKATSSKGKQKSAWTVMFYIAGDSNISASMIFQLKAITDAGYQEDTTVLVYFDPNCNGRNAKIFNVNDQRKQEGPKTVIGDGRDFFVRNIIDDCYQPELTQRPAQDSLKFFLDHASKDPGPMNYLLFLIGHGVIVGNDAFLPDADDNSAITLKQLGTLLRDFGDSVRKKNGEFHLVGFHSCSMSAVEVAYQLQGTAHYMIGTEGAAFPGSWPYRQLLKKIFSSLEESKGRTRNTRSNQALVRKLLRGVQDLSFYNSPDFSLAGFSADLSLCSLDKAKVERLTVPVQELVRALKAGLRDSRAIEIIVLAHWKAQSYFQEQYSDLYDFASCLFEQCTTTTEPQKAIREASSKIMQELETHPAKPFDRVVVYSDFFGPSYQFSHGLSIYFPWSGPTAKTLNQYRDYAFTTACAPDSWMSFLDEYFAQTQRRVRSEQVQPAAMPRGLTGTLGPAPDRKTATMGSPSGRMVRTLGPPPDKVLGALGPPPDKVLGALGPPPDKVLGALGPPPDKVLGALGPPPDKVLGALGPPPDKVLGALGPPPDKVLGALGPPPDKVLGSLGPPPDKVLGALGPPPDKVLGALGDAGLAVIKNFWVPPGWEVITSRPKESYAAARKRSWEKKSGKKRSKPGKTTT